MLEWIKNLLGIRAAELVLSLEQRHQKANDLQNDAISLFDRIVEDLEEAGNALSVVASEAHAKAQELLAQSEKAVSDAVTAKDRADKIRAILG